MILKNNIKKIINYNFLLTSIFKKNIFDGIMQNCKVC
jgi:hypothetical protein